MIIHAFIYHFSSVKPVIFVNNCPLLLLFAVSPQAQSGSYKGCLSKAQTSCICQGFTGQRISLAVFRTQRLPGQNLSIASMQRAISELSLGDTTEPTPIARSLVDLPAKIRNLIYHFALVKSESLDLWPPTRCNTIPISEGEYTFGDHDGDGARFRLAIKSMR